MRPGHERDGSLLTHACRAVNSGALLTGPIACMPCGGLWRGPDRPREDRIVAARGQERAKSGSPSPTEQLGARGRDREREREARRQSSQERAVGRERERESMGSLVGATLTVLLALFTLCGAIPLGPCTSTGAQAVVNASGLCAVPVAPALSPVCGAQERSECGAQERYECGAQERYECAAQEHYV